MQEMMKNLPVLLVVLLCAGSCRHVPVAGELSAPIRLEATLTARTPIPPPEQDPHRYCFVVHLYEIKRALSANAPKLGTRIGVVHWAVRDNQIIPEANRFTSGQTYTLSLDPWELHREFMHIRRYDPPSVERDHVPPYFFDVGLERTVLLRESQMKD